MDKKPPHYDWFKGNSNNKKDIKKNLKVSWKFTKIFLYFSLFFFSMWGCVQTFTHKVNSQVTSGLTLANGDHNLSPKQTVFTIKNTGDNKYPIITWSAKKIYETRSKEDGAYVIDQTNKELKRLGIKRPNDARYGGNYLVSFKPSKNIRFATNPQETIFKNSKRKFVPVVYSTALKKYKWNEEVAQDILKITKLGISDNKLDDYQHSEYNIKNILEESQDNKKNPQKLLAAKFNWEAFNFIYKFVEIKRENNGYISIEKYLNEIKNNFINEGFDKTKELSKEEIQKINSYNQIVDFLVLKVLNIETTTQDGNYTINQQPLGYVKDASWRPITTWNDAWSKDGGYGPFFGIFVWPISYVANAILGSMPIMAGWESFFTICLVVILVSLLMFALNFKNTLAQTKMQELSAKKAIIDAKYAPYKGNKQMENRQRQEVAEMYKKQGISPMSALASAFITMPFFIAMWRVIGTIDHIKGTIWVGINFAATSWRQLFSNIGSWEGGWVYFPLMLLSFSSSIFSQLFPRILTKKRDGKRINVQQREAMKKGNKMQNIMLFAFAFISLIFSAGLQVYFIVRSLWRISETYITHLLLIKNRKNKIARAKGVI